MRRNNPVISTAKVRGLIKKNGIGYVDATRRMYPSIATGVSVWQLCDGVYFEVYGYCDSAKIEAIEKQFTEVLAVEGFSVKKSHRSWDIVKAVADHE
jgi:hypothetical protein